MMKPTRRQFLSISAVAASAWVVGVGGQRRALARQTGGELVLPGGDADIWAGSRLVSGTVSDPACQSVTVTVNRESFDVPVHEGRFSLIVALAEGDNHIVAACDDLTSEPIVYVGKLRDVPRSNITISIEDDGLHLDGSGSTPSAGQAAAITGFRWTARPTNPAALAVAGPEDVAGASLADGVETPSLVLEAPAEDGEYYLSLTVTDAEGQTDRSETYFTVADGVPFLSDWATENTAWVENAVVYGVIPRNFGSPGFQAVIDRLDSLQDLGVDALWLAPTYPSPPGDYGYAVEDYFDVHRRNGTLEDFRRLVQEAHARGIRILLDFVPNHTSDTHPYFRSATLEGTASPYWDFYARNEDGTHTHYFDWTNLPNLNFENPEVRRWMLEAFAFWVREFDVDGYRVDVAWGIRERRPDFWMEWRNELKRIKPDLLLLAEATARDDFYFTGGFDAAYDWTSQLGHWAWELVWEDRDLLTFNLNAALTNLRQGFHEDALIFRFLNNNDTGSRFVSKYGPEMTRVATALLLTLPGIPCIYTGDEVGARFSPYYDPGAISWDDDFGLRDYHKRLIALRHQTPSLHSRFWTPVNAEPRRDVYAYLRHLEDGSEPVLVVLNFATEPVEATLTLPDDFAALAERTAWTDRITGDSVPVAAGDGALTLTVPPSQALVLG